MHDVAGIELRPYQKEAVAAIAEGLANGGRGQLHAACGSGKTVISVAAGTRLVPDGGLVVALVPTLPLVAQTIDAWGTFSRVDAVLAVCSDDTVADAAAHLADVPARVTTSPVEIADWLAQTSGRRLIVCTYVSASRLAEALCAADVVADLAVHDEAHHLTGRPEFVTRRILDDKFLPAWRRLFMTATPRVDDVRVDTSGGLSMSDASVFGPVLYSYEWARAIREGHLDDYRVLVMGVSEQEMLRLLRDEEKDHYETPGGPDVRTVAAQAVLAKAARKFGLRRVIAFNHRLEAAGEFVRTLPSVLDRLPADERPEGVLHAERISGDQPHAVRDRVLDRLREPPVGGWTVLANVRCLSEGVDVPAVDSVLFAHPKRSQVDIVQAVGRALRTAAGVQGVATIILPIVIPDSDEEVGDLDPREFRTLWQVLRALRAHDDTLGIELDSQRSRLSVHSPQLPSRIMVVLPPGTTGSLLAQLKVLLVRKTASPWWEGYGHAQAFYEATGHLQVPYRHETSSGFRLWDWVRSARQHRRKGWLSADRVAALDRIGMVWDTSAMPWHRFVSEMQAFRKSHGHALVPQEYRTPDGYRLGMQVAAARVRQRRVPAEVRRTLDDLGMIWDTRSLRWQQLYEACVEYAAHGDLNAVPTTYRTPAGYGLGERLKRLRRLAAEDALEPAERASLEELGMVFSREDRPWLRFLEACDNYVQQYGSLATVGKRYVDETGYRLGNRISYYRASLSAPDPDAITARRRTELDRRGMAWLAPAQVEISAQQASVLTALSGPELGAEIVRLVDEAHVSRVSIAAALSTHRDYLNARISAYRKTGKWPARNAHTKVAVLPEKSTR